MFLSATRFAHPTGSPISSLCDNIYHNLGKQSGNILILAPKKSEVDMSALNPLEVLSFSPEPPFGCLGYAYAFE